MPGFDDMIPPPPRDPAEESARQAREKEFLAKLEALEARTAMTGTARPGGDTADSDAAESEVSRAEIDKLQAAIAGAERQPAPKATEEQAPRAAMCEHYWSSHVLGGFPISVRSCQLCRAVDWNDLKRELYEAFGRDAVANVRRGKTAIPVAPWVPRSPFFTRDDVTVIPDTGPPLPKVWGAEADRLGERLDAERAIADHVRSDGAPILGWGETLALYNQTTVDIPVQAEDGSDVGEMLLPIDQARVLVIMLADAVTDAYEPSTERLERKRLDQLDDDQIDDLYDRIDAAQQTIAAYQLREQPETWQRQATALAKQAREIGELKRERDEAKMWARHGYEIGQRSCLWSDYGVSPAWLTEGLPRHGVEACEHLTGAVAEYDLRIAAQRKVERVSAMAARWQYVPGKKDVARDILAALGTDTPEQP